MTTAKLTAAAKRTIGLLMRGWVLHAPASSRRVSWMARRGTEEKRVLPVTVDQLILGCYLVRDGNDPADRWVLLPAMERERILEEKAAVANPATTPELPERMGPRVNAKEALEEVDEAVDAAADDTGPVVVRPATPRKPGHRIPTSPFPPSAGNPEDYSGAYLAGDTTFAGGATIRTAVTIDPDAPISDLLRAAVGLKGEKIPKARLASLLGRAPNWTTKAIRRGNAIQLATLVCAADALGLDLQITATRAGEPIIATMVATPPLSEEELVEQMKRDQESVSPIAQAIVDRTAGEGKSQTEGWFDVIRGAGTRRSTEEPGTPPPTSVESVPPQVNGSSWAVLDNVGEVLDVDLLLEEAELKVGRTLGRWALNASTGRLGCSVPGGIAWIQADGVGVAPSQLEAIDAFRRAGA